MINLKKVKYHIVGKSEMLEGAFVPTAHGHFDSYSEAHAHAAKHMKTVPFKVEPVKR